MAVNLFGRRQRRIYALRGFEHIAYRKETPYEICHENDPLFYLLALFYHK